MLKSLLASQHPHHKHLWKSLWYYFIANWLIPGLHVLVRRCHSSFILASASFSVVLIKVSLLRSHKQSSTCVQPTKTKNVAVKIGKFCNIKVTKWFYQDHLKHQNHDCWNVMLLTNDPVESGFRDDQKQQINCPDRTSKPAPDPKPNSNLI